MYRTLSIALIPDKDVNHSGLQQSITLHLWASVGGKKSRLLKRLEGVPGWLLQASVTSTCYIILIECPECACMPVCGRGLANFAETVDNKNIYFQVGVPQFGQKIWVRSHIYSNDCVQFLCEVYSSKTQWIYNKSVWVSENWWKQILLITFLFLCLKWCILFPLLVLFMKTIITVRWYIGFIFNLCCVWNGVRPLAQIW